VQKLVQAWLYTRTAVVMALPGRSSQGTYYPTSVWDRSWAPCILRWYFWLFCTLFHDPRPIAWSRLTVALTSCLYSHQLCTLAAVYETGKIRRWPPCSSVIRSGLVPNLPSCYWAVAHMFPVNFFWMVLCRSSRLCCSWYARINWQSVVRIL
jgi:hypothetical protein